MLQNKTKIYAIGALPPGTNANTLYELINPSTELETELLLDEKWGPRTLYFNLANEVAQEMLANIASYGGDIHFERISLRLANIIGIDAIQSRIKVNKLFIEVEDCPPNVLKTYSDKFTGFNQLLLMFKSEYEIDPGTFDSIEIFEAYYSGSLRKAFPLHLVPLGNKGKVEGIGLDSYQFSEWNQNTQNAFLNLKHIILRELYYGDYLIDGIKTVLGQWKLDAKVIVEESKASLVEENLVKAKITFVKGEVEYSKVTFHMRSDDYIFKRVSKIHHKVKNENI